MSNHAETAARKHAEGYNCAQAVMFAFAGECGLSEDAALKGACGFGGGMGRKQEVCGAVTAGILVLGHWYGRGTQEDRAVGQEAYRKTGIFMDAFAARNGSYVCRDLLSGCDLGTEEGQKIYRENELSTRVCRQCVRSAAEILEGMVPSGKP
ncbi:MAG: C-GCAxxG-C-C family protein [Acidobacteria bacterium]|nr:C-GCAxxG-C-C family protein [Acidobacteriota bacterium]